MLDRLHSYTPVFICIGSLLPVALIAGTLTMGKVYALKLEAGR